MTALVFLSVITLIICGSTEPEPVTDMGKRHFALAKQTELESMVLLENKENILPLNKDIQNNIAVFGNGALVPTNGSSGSGTATGAFTHNLYEGLNAIGVHYDEMLYKQYNDNIAVTSGFGVSMRVNHHWNTTDTAKWGHPRFSNSGWNRSSPIATPELDLPDNMVASAAESGSDKTAVVYLTRGVGTEEMDRFDQPSDWYLNPSEYTLLKQVTREFDKVIIVLNTSGSMDLSWMDFNWLSDDPDYNEGGTISRKDAKAFADKIKALIVSYGSGSYHGLVMAELLYGDADFSGKLADSMTKTYDQQPTKDNFHYRTYADKGLNYKDFNSLNGQIDPVYLYQEGIFTGYRYFDTFAADAVLYPFGYGLTYNTYKFGNYKVAADQNRDVIMVSATISNTSNNKSLPAGKEVMEVYVSAPEGKLEQPYQKLLDYNKSPYLDQGSSVTVKVEIPVPDLAAYDESKAAYVLEAGDYIIRVGNSSRNTHIAGVITVEDEIIVEQLSNKLTLNGADPDGQADNKAVYNAIRFSTKAKRPADPAVYAYANPDDRKELKKAKAIVLNHNFIAFRDNSGNSTSFTAGDAPADHVATLTAVRKGEIGIRDFVAQMTKDELVNFLSGGYTARNSDQYYSDDPALQINNLSSKDAGEGWMGGAGSSRNIRRLGIPSLTYADGSAGIPIGAANAKQLGIDQNPGFARAAGMACTWNPELQYQWGKAIGEEMRAINVDIWLAPSINLHRNPLNGRNTEYYSEDPVLSGRIAERVASGVAENGVTVCLKHFAGNDQEWFRRGLHTPASDAQGINKDAANTIASERALREITLKPFEMAVKSGHVMCVMSAFNKINGRYCAASSELLTDILRGEWNYKGYVVTDWGDFDEIPHAADEMRAGNDMIMSGFHNRFSIPDQIYQNAVANYVGTPHTVSLDQLQRNAAYVLNTILFSRNAFDDNNNYNLERQISNKLEILTTELPAAIVGMDYAKVKVNPVIVTGSEGTTQYRFTLADTGELLPGSLVLHGNGTITGTPSAENTGKYNLVIRVEDDQGNTATKALELKVAFLGLATADLPVGRLEMEYSNQFKGFRILGGKPPYIFELTQGSLPDGLQLGEDGKISGIPEQKGEFPVSVRVSDSQNNTFGKDYTLKIEDVIDVTLSPGSPMTGVTSGNYITIRIAAKRTGFNDAYDYRLIDAPGWLSLSSNWFGTSITGKPSEPGTYHFKLQVSVSGSPVSMEVPYTIAVDETQTYSSLQITTEQLGEGRVNVPYSQTLSASGGTGTRSFGFTGKGDKLDGLSISADGTITWTPAGQDYGYHTLEIEAKDQEGHIASKRFEIYIRGGITVDPPNGTELPATTNKEFSQRISGSGGTVESYLYVLSNKGDQLPAGLTFNNGLISGTPAPGTAGDYNLVIRASENGGSFSGTEVKYHLKVSE